MFGMTYPDSIPIVPQYDGPAPGRCGPGAPPGCGQHPAEPQLYERTSGGDRTPVAFTGLGVSPRAFHMPWVRGDWGPSWAWTWMPGGAPVEGAAPGFRGLGGLGDIPAADNATRSISPFAYTLASILDSSAVNYAALGLHRVQVVEAAAKLTGTSSTWRDLRAAACGSGTRTARDVIRAWTIGSAVAGGVQAILTAAHVNTGDVGQVLRVASNILGDVDGLLAEIRSHWCATACVPNGPCSDASKCPSGTVWLATRSVPEGGMCVDPESYRQMVRATTPTGVPTTSAKKSSAPVIIGVSVAALAVGVLVYALA